MKFKIIANEQTPEVKNWTPADTVIERHSKMMVKFLSFASRQTNCCGLAANQVSCDGYRIMVYFFVIKIGHVWDLVICPEILKYIGKSHVEYEGCLTWLGKKIEAERYNKIEVKYYNIKGKEFRRTITGLEAQIWQHEYNHLKGVEEKIIW